MTEGPPREVQCEYDKGTHPCENHAIAACEVCNRYFCINHLVLFKGRSLCPEHAREAVTQEE